MSAQAINIFLQRLPEYEGITYHKDLKGIETAPLGIVINNRQNQSIAQSLNITLDKSISVDDAEKIARVRAEQDFEELSKSIGNDFKQLKPEFQAVVLDAKFNAGTFPKLAKNLVNFQTSPTSDNQTAVIQESRRVIDGKPVRGLDNRVFKTLFDSGIVSSLDDVKPILTLANTTDRLPTAKETRDEILQTLTQPEAVPGTPIPKKKPQSPLPVGTMRFTGTSEAQPEEKLPSRFIEKRQQDTQSVQTVTDSEEPLSIIETREQKPQQVEPEPDIQILEQRAVDERVIEEPDNLALLERNKQIEESQNIPEITQPPDTFKKPKRDTNLLTPSRPISASQIRATERAFEAEKKTLSIDIAKRVIDEDWGLSYVFEGREQFKPDPDFQLTESFARELTADLPEDYHAPILENSFSEAQARFQRQEALKQFAFDKDIGELGWKGVALRMGAAVVDPFAIAVSIATEGVAAPLIWGNKLSRLGRVFRGATTAGATNAAIEAYLVSQNDFKDPYDILYAMSAGIVLGGGVGALGRTDTSDPMIKALSRMATHADNAQKIETTNAIKTNVLDGDPNNELSVGAAVNPDSLPNQVRELRSDMDDVLDQAGEPVEAAATKLGPIPLRFDMAGYLLNSPNRIANFLGRILPEDPVGFRKDKNLVIQESADILKTNSMKASFARFYQVYDTAYKDWAKSQGYGLFRRTFNLPRREFGELVADAIENPDLPVSAPIRTAANRQAEIQRDLLRAAKKAGVEGFESVPENLSYFTHLWDDFKFRDASDKFGENSVINLLTRSLMKGTEDLQEEAAQKIAERMVFKLNKSAAGMDAGAARLFNATDRDVMRQILIDEEFMSAEEADNLMNLFSQKPDGTPARAKRRLRFDMNHAETVVRKKGGQQEVLRIKDLQDRDAEQVFTRYAAELSGRNALATVGIKSERSFNKLLDRNLAEAADREGNAGRARAEKDNLVAQTIFNMIINRRAPLAADAQGNYARIARLVQDYNFTRLMNQVGFAQIAELGNALAIGGFRGVLQSVPSIKSMLKRARNGEIEDPVMKDLEGIIGVGSDRLTMQAMNKADTIGVFSEGRGDLIDKALFAMQPLKRITADISGMAPVTLALERMAARIAVQTLTDVAFRSRKLSRARLAGLGLSDEMSERVFNQIKKNAITQPSTLFRNRKIKAINLAQWDDTESRDAFTVAIARWTRRSIQQNDVGNLNLYMTSTMGQILIQFRTFMLVSHAKQFLHNVKAKDFKAFSAMMYSCTFAGLSYMAQQQANAIGREDKEEFLKERLSVESIAKASFQRSSWAALFPGLIDTGASFFIDDPIFAYRSTGLDTQFITGNPTVQLVSKGLSSAQAVSRSIVNPDLQFSQGQQRALNTIIPFNNALGIKNALNKLVDMRPETTQVE